jgi:hypothetical protein
VLLAFAAFGGLVAGAAAVASGRAGQTGARAAAQARVDSAAVRLGTQLQQALSFTEQRAERLRASPVVRAAVEIDTQMVRDLWRHDPLARVVPGETFELTRPFRSRLRVPADAAALPSLDPGKLQLDSVDGGLRVSVGATVEPLFPHGKLAGVIVVSQVVPLDALTALQDLGATLDDTTPPSTTLINALVHCPALPSLTITAHHVRGGGGLIWTGRALLVVALGLVLAALIVLWRGRRRLHDDSLRIDVQPFEYMPPSHTSDEPTIMMRRQRNVPQPVDAETTAREAPHAIDGAPQGPELARTPDGITPMPQLLPDKRDSAAIAIDPRAELLSGRYRLIKHLGRGSHADVYLAQALARGGGFVSLKLLSSTTSLIDFELQLDAARHMLPVIHPNLARVLEVDEGAAPFIASEYVEGCNLEQLARGLGAELPAAQCVAIAVAICHAIEAAPLVHGAIKPRNVLVGRHNAIKLVDFCAPPSPTDRLAPEQYAGKRSDQRTDVYAVGVLLHELLTGERVYPASPGEMRWPALSPPSKRRPEVGPTIDAVIARATAFGPRQRHPDAEALRLDLERAAAHLERSATVLGEFVERARRTM